MLKTLQAGHAIGFGSAFKVPVSVRIEKPNPEPLLMCLERLQLAPSEAIYIGDSSSDQEAANNASIDFGYAKWGSVSSFPLNCKYVFDKPIDLLKLIQQ